MESYLYKKNFVKELNSFSSLMLGAINRKERLERGLREHGNLQSEEARNIIRKYNGVLRNFILNTELNRENNNVVIM